ncbi:hypothetical protein IJ670_04320 [bacterium]|nr:hypothetical protein [bacterium]
MIIQETKIKKADGEYLQIEFKFHKTTIYVAEVPTTFDRCPVLRLVKAKTEVIEKFLKSPEGKKFTQKEVYKAYSLIDKHLLDIYKEKYPHGGWRNGGRPKGRKTKKTERFNAAITPEEKEFLLKALEDYRKNKKNSKEV